MEDDAESMNGNNGLVHGSVGERGTWTGSDHKVEGRTQECTHTCDAVQLWTCSRSWRKEFKVAV